MYFINLSRIGPNTLPFPVFVSAFALLFVLLFVLLPEPSCPAVIFLSPLNSVFNPETG